MASTLGRGVGEKETAARRMKGVVRPQAMPTRRKPRVQRRGEGEEEEGGGDMVGGGMGGGARPRGGEGGR